MTLIRIKPSNLAAGSVLEAALATGSVSTNKIAGAAVTDEKLSSTSLIRYHQRQTVLQGPENADGTGSWIVSADAGSLIVKTQNISASLPLIVSASQGYGAGYGSSSERIGSCSVAGNDAGNLRWTLTANSGVNYLYVDVNADGTLTAGKTTTAPVYSRSATSGTNTFNINQMVMYTSGTTKGFRVFVGEATAGASGYSGAFAYAHRGEFYDDFTDKPNVSGGTNPSSFTVSHKIGAPCVPLSNPGSIICTTGATISATAVATGAIFTHPSDYGGNAYTAGYRLQDKNTAYLDYSGTSTGYCHYVLAGGIVSNLSGFQNNFRLIHHFKRIF